MLYNFLEDEKAYYKSYDSKWDRFEIVNISKIYDKIEETYNYYNDLHNFVYKEDFSILEPFFEFVKNTDDNSNSNWSLNNSGLTQTNANLSSNTTSSGYADRCEHLYNLEGIENSKISIFSQIEINEKANNSDYPTIFLPISIEKVANKSKNITASVSLFQSSQVIASKIASMGLWKNDNRISDYDNNWGTNNYYANLIQNITYLDVFNGVKYDFKIVIDKDSNRISSYYKKSSNYEWNIIHNSYYDNDIQNIINERYNIWVGIGVYKTSAKLKEIRITCE